MVPFFAVLTWFAVLVPPQPVEPVVPQEVVVTDIAPPVEFGRDKKPIVFLPNVWHMTDGGQVCPISKTEALTARHISQLTPLLWGYPNSAYGGTLVEVWTDTRRDLGMVRIASGPAFQRFYRIATVPPQKDDKLYIQGYVRGEGFTSAWYEVKVVTLYAGNVDFSGTPGRGSSGSCVLNDKGEVVAINYASFQPQDMGPFYGSGLLLTAPWGFTDPQWQVMKEETKK